MKSHKALGLTVLFFTLEDKGNIDGEGGEGGLPLLQHLLHRIDEC